jgi:hypothetical protein
MSRNSRSYAGAALLAAWISIPAVAQAQASTAERSLMNHVGWDPRSHTGEHQPASSLGTGEQSPGSRALRNTVGAIRFIGSETGAADSGSPTPEQALLGQSRRNTRKKN